jgi:hypothetical protein
MLAGCRDSGKPANRAPPLEVFADRVISNSLVGVANWPVPPDPNRAKGPPGGPTDSVFLGFDPTGTAIPALGQIVLGWGAGGTPYCVNDGNGPEFIVYSGVTSVPDAKVAQASAIQVMTIEVSSDNQTWFPFPITGVQLNLSPDDPLRYSSGIAGVHPTLGRGASATGGDPLDLSYITNLPLDFEACYIRITDGGSAIPDYGNAQTDPLNLGGAVDAVRLLSPHPRPGLTP